MPIGNLSNGKSFRGALRYVWQKLDHKGDARPTIAFIGGTVRDQDPDAAARHFGLIRRTRQTRRDAVRHISVRCAEEDAPKFDTAMQAEIADRIAERMGYDTWQAVSHGDHLHIIASLIRSDGSVADDSWNYARLEQQLREIREEYGLREVDASPALDPEQPRGSKPGEDGFERRTGRKADKKRLREAMYAAAEQAQGQDARAFLDALEALGIDVQARWTNDGALKGYALALPDGDAGPMPAGKIERTLTIKHLQQDYQIDPHPQQQEVSDDDRGAAPSPGAASARDEAPADQDRAALAADGRPGAGEPDRRDAGSAEQPGRDDESDAERSGQSGGRSFRERLRAAARLLTMRARVQANAAPEDLRRDDEPGPSGPPTPSGF